MRSGAYARVVEHAADAADESTTPETDRDLATLATLEQDLASLEGELDRIDHTETSDLGQGDLGQGDLGQGDLGQGDLGQGDLGRDEPGSDESRPGESGSGPDSSA